MIITIDNCRDASCSPTGYSYPELIVSRTDPTPRFLDYRSRLDEIPLQFGFLKTLSLLFFFLFRFPMVWACSWKLIYLNYITINHTDPSARDLNGYLPGSFYVSVFGWVLLQTAVS